MRMLLLRAAFFMFLKNFLESGFRLNNLSMKTWVLF